MSATNKVSELMMEPNGTSNSIKKVRPDGIITQIPGTRQFCVIHEGREVYFISRADAERFYQNFNGQAVPKDLQ